LHGVLQDSVQQLHVRAPLNLNLLRGSDIVGSDIVAAHGFDQASTDHGQGLESMRRRAEKLAGQLDLISQPNAGTLVILKAPLGRHG
jgi:glucose-6-phosphate-specific signal transduction histidine kinase